MTSQHHKPFPFTSVLDWYQKNSRHTLPWRQIYHLPDRERLYKVWIAEVMLQQTQADRVIAYYSRFLERYPTLESLAETTYEELFPYYQGLGYYSRARRMIQVAQAVAKDCNGVFPDDLTALQKLPGIGIYTAQALLAFGYNQPLLAIDANLEKIFSRYYFGTRYSRKDDLKAIMSQLSFSVYEQGLSGRELNNALMDFGAYTSSSFAIVASNPYPLSSCKWFETEGKYEQKTTLRVQQKTLQKYSCLVFLHENHKKYWSSIKNGYEPFLIAPVGKDDRKSIQDYFGATYGLEVSVRPSFGNGEIIPGLGFSNPGIDLPVKLFHAQIQTGFLAGKEYRKEIKKEWQSQNVSILGV